MKVFDELGKLPVNVLQGFTVCFQSLDQLVRSINRFLWYRLAKPFQERSPTGHIRALVRRS